MRAVSDVRAVDSRRHVYRSTAECGYSASAVRPSFLSKIEVSETMVSDHLMEGYMGALDAAAGAAEQKLEESGSVLAEALVRGGLLDAEEARASVGKGLGLAAQARSKFLGLLQSRPDTS